MRVRVETYSGYKADQRPVRFEMNGRTYEIEAVEDQWFSPGATWFRVLAGGGIYVLKHALPPGEWTIESFRRPA
jgi:hypothetical protein